MTDIISSTAFSLTLSGNSGISPFLTMLLIGLMEKISPEQFNMGETMDKIMASWPSLVLWSILTILEYVGKCVPVLDQIMDSIEAFIVPILSSLASLSTFGAYGSSENENNSNNNNVGNTSVNYDVNEDGNERNLASMHSVTSGARVFLQIIIIFFGILLALSLHFFKMFIRLLGEGCLTQFITVIEATTVITGVLISVFVRQFAIFIAGCMILAAGYNAKRRYEKWEEKTMQEEDGRVGNRVLENEDNNASAVAESNYEQMKDSPVEEQSGSAHV